jgi:aquaporin Z
MSESKVYGLPARLGAEALGTFWLVFGGCGTAVFAATYLSSEHAGVGWLGVALAFGLTVLTGVYAFGPVSGGHFNPAVSVGLAAAKRFSWRDVPAYIAAQLVGGVLAATALFVIASGRPGFDAKKSFAVNGYGTYSPEGYSLAAVIIAETILTAFFLYIIIGATSKRAPAGFAGLAIGLALTLIHLISIPISNTSVNPVRSISVALFSSGAQLSQQWVFILAPTLGALIAGYTHALITSDEK